MKSKPKHKRQRIIIALILMVSSLSIANIIAAATAATTGKTLQELSLKAQQLQAQNQDLGRKITTEKSLFNIQQKAIFLGLISYQNVLSLNSPEPLAQVPAN